MASAPLHANLRRRPMPKECAHHGTRTHLTVFRASSYRQHRHLALEPGAASAAVDPEEWVGIVNGILNAESRVVERVSRRAA